jgi:gustatory receptor
MTSLQVKMDSNSLSGSFHDAIGPVLKIAQFFGLLPAENIAGKDISTINFKWKSVKTVYSVIFLFCGTIECILCFRMIFVSNMSLGYASAMSFYMISMFGAFCLFNMAKKWKTLMKFWYEKEKVLLKAPYKMHGLSLKQKIRLWAAVIGFLSFRNHKWKFQTFSRYSISLSFQWIIQYFL